MQTSGAADDIVFERFRFTWKARDFQSIHHIVRARSIEKQTLFDSSIPICSPYVAAATCYLDEWFSLIICSSIQINQNPMDMLHPIRP